jgi:hypothetical protein
MKLMNTSKLSTPVVLVIFKRPDTTRKVLDAIRQVKPNQLFVIADGPRTDRLGEVEKTKATRQLIDEIDWPCEIVRNYSDVNLGCERRMTSGLNWVFDQVEKAIILEDDCVPHSTFFQFCEELLDYYELDQRIMSVSGLSAPSSHLYSNLSYCFSRFNRCWGWATWKRAWNYYDYSMALWPELQAQGFLKNLFPSSREAGYWQNIFQAVYTKRVNSWAYRWTFACWIQHGLSVLPNKNLVTNVGFGADATHTLLGNKNRANLPLEEVSFPLCHPQFVIRDLHVDKFLQRTIHNPTKSMRIRAKVRQSFNF